ncbi:MAG: glycosyltransferase family 4 protein [Candidatus Micrarchaeia archaeon]
MAGSLHIVGNTSSSTEAFARRTNEISRFVSGIGRQSSELERNMGPGMRLSLIRTHPEQRCTEASGPVSRHILPLSETIGTLNPNNIYRRSDSISSLRENFAPLIREMMEIVKGADVVLLGGTYFVPWCLLQAARALRKPVVLCYAGILSMEIGHMPDDMQRTLRIMEKDFYDPDIFYIFPSALTKRTVEGIFGQELGNSEIIHNGVPLEFLSVDSPPQRRFPVAFIGRNTPVKNPEFLLDLALALGGRHQVFMVTKEDEGNRLIRDLRKAGVAVLDPMDTGSLAGFYSETGVVVSPSRFETYGNVPLESVSAGTPALVSSSMGVSEVFSMLGLGGYVGHFSDARAVAAHVERIISDGERVPEEVRERIRAGLSWPAVISRYLRICVRLAAQCP